jgi:hypothetical protein
MKGRCPRLDAAGQPGRVRSSLRLTNRFLVRIDADDRCHGKVLGECHAHPAGAAADVERATAGLQAGGNVRQRLEPVAGEPLFVLAAIHQIEADDRVRAERFELDAAAARERGGDIGCDAHQHRRHGEQAAHEMVGVVGREQECVLVGRR